MGKYLGKISGIGDKATRENEITADDLAILRNFIVGHTYGVIEDYEFSEIASSHHDFYCWRDENSNNLLHLTDGIAFAYGYVAYSKAIDISILLPAVDQYHLIYLEIDKSEVPNVCTVKVKNNMSNPNINVTTFRQDQLSTIRTGIFQIPLWQIHITNEGIKAIQDLRTLRSKIENVSHSDTANHVNNGGIIGNNVTAVTQDININSDLIATTAYVQNLIKYAVNGNVMPDPTEYEIYYGGVLGNGRDLSVNFSCNHTKATQGTRVTFTAVCIEEEKEITNVSVDADYTGELIPVIYESNNTYSFIMPAESVTITVYVMNKE